jgi:hypothetical protein
MVFPTTISGENKTACGPNKIASERQCRRTFWGECGANVHCHALSNGYSHLSRFSRGAAAEPAEGSGAGLMNGMQLTLESAR